MYVKLFTSVFFGYYVAERDITNLKFSPLKPVFKSGTTPEKDPQKQDEKQTMCATKYKVKHYWQI